MNSFITRKKAKRAVAETGHHPARLDGHVMPSCPNAVSVDWQNRVVAQTSRQRYGTLAVFGYYSSRPIYAPMVCRCGNCHAQFEWTVAQQVFRYEVAKLHAESYPPYCPACSRAWHGRKRLLAEYDALVGAARETGDLALKERVLGIIAALCESGYTPPGRMLYTESLLGAQLAKAARLGMTAPTPAPVTRNGRSLHY